VGAATWAKLAAMEGDPARCRAILEEGEVVIRDQPDRDAGGFCALRNVLTIRGGDHAAPARGTGAHLPGGAVLRDLGASGAAARRPNQPGNGGDRH
jgi:hypothetical protein